MYSHQPQAAPAGSLLFEHRFWLQILGDHSRFILDALSPREAKDIRQADQFIRRFDELLNQARQASSESQALAIAAEAHAATMELKNFKLDLLRRLLLGQVTVFLPPTFFNHMLNELQEYVYILDAVRAGKPCRCSRRFIMIWCGCRTLPAMLRRSRPIWMRWRGG